MRPVVVVLALFAFASCGGTTPPQSTPPAATASPSPSPTATPTDPFAKARAYESSTPSQLAKRLAAAEAAIRSEDGDVSTHARVQQAAYRQLVVRPEWRDKVFALLPAALRPVAVANVQAGAELRALTPPRTELPPWRIVAPPPADELHAHYAEAERMFGVPWQVLAAIHLVETRMGRIRGVSTAGARGPMQFLPSTWARWGKGDIENARDSILAAARYLDGHGAPQDMPRALFAYNRSRHYVRAIQLYTEQMRANERAFVGYYHWQVYYRTNKGDALLEVGWKK